MPFGAPRRWVVRVPLRMIHFLFFMVVMVEEEERGGVGSGAEESVVVVEYRKGLCFG